MLHRPDHEVTVGTVERAYHGQPELLPLLTELEDLSEKLARLGSPAAHSGAITTSVTSPWPTPGGRHGWRTTRPGMPPLDVAVNASRASASG